MDVFQRFREVIADPAGYARQWKADHDGEVIGSFCSYAPEEILLAAGVLGFRIFGSGNEISKADAHLQAYSCSLVRGALEEKLEGGLDFLDGVVFPHTCDSIQRLSDIWRMNITEGFHLDLVMPVKLNTDSARAYMVDVIKRFKSDLERALGRDIPEDKLKEAIDTCNRIREVIGRIYGFRQQKPGVIKGSDMHAMVKAGMMMDRNDYLAHVETVEKELENAEAGVAEGKKRLVLSGGLCNMPDIYDVIEGAGAVVVADDLCTGRRFFEGAVAPDTDPLEAIADRYSGRTVCPAKHAGNRSRGNYLLSLARESKADGVIYIFLKFCDPHGFDYPYIREMLGKDDIACMLYEMEDQQAGGGQFATRCEAFVEML